MKIFFYILSIVLLYGCNHDCYRTIEGVELTGAKEYGKWTTEEQFLNKSIILEAVFQINQDIKQFPSNCKEPVIKTNSLDPATLKITCSEDLYINADTLKKNVTNLIDKFDYIISDDDGLLSYISFKNKQAFNNPTGFYTFYFSCSLSDNRTVEDSCLVKITF